MKYYAHWGGHDKEIKEHPCVKILTSREKSQEYNLCIDNLDVSWECYTVKIIFLSVYVDINSGFFLKYP